MLHVDNLPFPKKAGKLKIFKLPNTLHLEQWLIPKGEKVMLFTSTDFGIIVLVKGCKTVGGIGIPKRIFKY